MAKNENNKKLLEVKKYDQYRTVDELMERSQPTEIYYTLLILSSIVIAAGLLLNNAAVVIGGMLITPLITPLLLVGLGISIGDLDVIKRTSIFVGESILIIIGSSLLIGFIFEIEGKPSFFALQDTLNGAVLYFIVALASGFSATFAWIRKEISEILPGVAVAVALVPPLALIGLGFSGLDMEIVRGNFFVFFFNLLGVLAGSVLVFSLLKFYRVEEKVKKEVKEQAEKKKEQKESKKEEKEADKGKSSDKKENKE